VTSIGLNGANEMDDELHYRDAIALRAAASINAAFIGAILFGPVGAVLGGIIGSYGGPRRD